VVGKTGQRVREQIRVGGQPGMQRRADKIFITRRGIFAQQVIQRAWLVIVHASMADIRDGLVKFGRRVGKFHVASPFLSPALSMQT
jgi:hypothetical protein